MNKWLEPGQERGQLQTSLQRELISANNLHDVCVDIHTSGCDLNFVLIYLYRKHTQAVAAPEHSDAICQAGHSGMDSTILRRFERLSLVFLIDARAFVNSDFSLSSQVSH